jgi:alanyl-tRNA synthetase
MGVLLTAGIPFLPATVGKLLAAETEARKEIESLRRQLLHYEAEELYQKAEPVGAARVVRVVLSERTLDEVKTLAREIARLPHAVAMLGLRGDDARLCFARAQDAPGDMGALVRQAAAVLGGRGGGRPQEAQGGGPEVGRLEEALQGAVDALGRVSS